ncbi:MAG TPA: hypothetical protein VK910_03670 [Thiobacillus sp.]|nr:hypothetical protein [Thiobacillus sp.]
MPLTLDALTILDAIERRGSFAPAIEALARAQHPLARARLALWTRALSQLGVLAEVLDAD